MPLIIFVLLQVYGDLFKELSYVNFSWTSNVTYKYPF